MLPLAWCRVGASVIGTSHLENGGRCEDAAVALERFGPEGPVLIAIVSDGAGSAERGAVGSRLTVRSIARAAAQFVISDSLNNLDETILRTWVHGLQAALATRATAEGRE